MVPWSTIRISAWLCCRNRLRKIWLLAFGIVLSPVALYVVYASINDVVEKNIFKGRLLHNHWESLRGVDRLPDAAGKGLIVFQHIPRTAADAMRTHLFGDTVVQSSERHSQVFNRYNQSYLSKADLELANNESTKMIKGFFSHWDLQQIKRRQRRIIFLRHPIERIASLYLSLRPVLHVRKFNNGSQSKPKELTFLEFVSFKNPWHCAMHHNAMFWQLGYHQHCQFRRGNKEADVMAQAKKDLEEAEFVGFYESLDEDFWAMRMQVFPDALIPAYAPLAFWFGTFLGLPRLKVLKYSQGLSAAEFNVLRGQTELDMALYNWARERFKPGLVLYDSYFDFFCHNLSYFLIASGSIGMCIGSGCFCWRQSYQAFRTRMPTKER